jgi:hypothetical protein
MELTTNLNGRFEALINNLAVVVVIGEAGTSALQKRLLADGASHAVSTS